MTGICLPNEMNKKLGIWTDDLTLENFLRLNNKGFNVIFLSLSPFWDEANKADGDYLTKQSLSAELMYKEYLRLRQLGFSFFLVDFGWGLGELDKNWFYMKVYEKFKDCDDVLFYFGEPIEQLVESKRFEYYDIKKVIEERFSVVGERLLIDGTTRNIGQLRKDFPHIKNAISSYYGQHKYWVENQTMCWIYGQLKFGGSLCYKKLAKAADENKIQIRFLYQADDIPFDLSIPYTWFNSLLRLIKLDKLFKRWMQKRFIKHFLIE